MFSFPANILPALDPTEWPNTIPAFLSNPASSFEFLTVNITSPPSLFLTIVATEALMPALALILPEAVMLPDNVSPGDGALADISDPINFPLALTLPCTVNSSPGVVVFIPNLALLEVFVM